MCVAVVFKCSIILLPVTNELRFHQVHLLQERIKFSQPPSPSFENIFHFSFFIFFSS